MDRSPEGGGTIEIDGDAPCDYPAIITVDLDDYITLEAVPATDYHFTGWSGEESAIDENDNPLDIKVTRNMAITANFAPDFTKFTSEDGVLNLLIPEGTTALDGEGEPLTSVDFVVVASPPPIQEGSLIGHAYNLEPNGATFDPPVTLVWDYGTADIPEVVVEEDMVIAYHDENSNQWVALESEVDPEDDIIRAPTIEHLTNFAVLAPLATPPEEATFTTDIFSISPVEVNPGEEVTISALVTNQSQVEGSQSIILKINGTMAETQNVTIGPGAFMVVTFEVTESEAGTYLVDINDETAEFTVKEAVSSPPPGNTSPDSPTKSSGINWAILAPILSAIFLAIFLPIKLKRRREGLDW